MATAFELAHRIPGQDFRRQYFARRLELLRQVSAEWEARARAEIEAILAQHPFRDG